MRMQIVSAEQIFILSKIEFPTNSDDDGCFA